MKVITCTALLLVLLLALGCTSQKIPVTHSIAELDDRINTVFNASSLPGCAVIVVDQKGVLYEKSMGYADIIAKRPYTTTTIQNIASVSKTVIGVAIMKAVDQGKLQLDDPINNYLPFKVTHPKFPKIPITIRHLATHSSGIQDNEMYHKSYVLKNPKGDFSYLPSEILDQINMLKENKFMDDSDYLRYVLAKGGDLYSESSFGKKAPGEMYIYSNIGASLAAYVLERAVAMPYEAYTKQFIFDPLSMNETHWHKNETQQNTYATLYFTKSVVVPAYHLITFQDGGLLTNAKDFGKYLSEMIRGLQGNGNLLSKQSYTELFNRVITKGGSSGIFWGVSAKGNPNHTGSDPGTLTITSISKTKRKGIYLVSNIDVDSNKKNMSSLRAIWKSVTNHNW